MRARPDSTIPLNPRPFYFSQIRVDPENDQRVYVLGFALHVSEDGGRTFREDRFEKVHPDNHALAIDPRSPRRLVLGTDGGVYQSFNGGETWDFLNRMAAGEYYRMPSTSGPLRVGGGFQTTRTGSAQPPSTRTDRQDWIDLGGGDGFYCAFTRDPDTIYTESQQANPPTNLAQRDRTAPQQQEGRPLSASTEIA